MRATRASRTKGPLAIVTPMTPEKTRANQAKEHQAEVALEVRTQLGEGPVWDERSQRLYFVDIVNQRVHTFWPATGEHRRFDVDRPVGAVVLRDDGGLVLAAHDTFFVAEHDGDALEPFGDFRADGELVRFNDGKVDPRGRFLAGTMAHAEDAWLGSLYMLEQDGKVTVVLEEVGVSNGLAWSADETTFFYIDTKRNSVDAFDLDPETGAVSNRRVVAEFSDGSPDGMAIDAEGCLWVACWGGHRVERIDPADGSRLEVVRVPATNVTSVAFGGPLLDDLYITTARQGLSEAQLAQEPHAGDLFVTRPGVSGPPPHRFKTTQGVSA
ncbi:MAG TPA: SMP-30/gluconolactonase/LRE family protein [Acidimicrobiales bacterium]|nr:SMP-30/gluconolactonase/LRE family protein [Acidimicrobiales bacterium]